MTNADAVIKQAFERPRWYVKNSAYNIRLRIETIQAFTRNLNPERILDIGCGDGTLSLHMLNSYNRITLLDRSRNMLELAKSQIPQSLANRVDTKNGDFMDVDLPERTYDLILCVGVMAYIEDRRAFVKKILSLLRPGGTLILECSDGAHFISKMNRAYDALRVKLGGAAFPTILKPAKDLVAIMSELGFEPSESFRYTLPPLAFGKILPQSISYKLIRLIHGTAPKNRSGWFGSECLFHMTPRANGANNGSTAS